MWWNNLEFRKTQTLKQTHVVWTYSFPKTKIWSLTAFPRHMELSLVKWNGGVELLGPKCVQYYNIRRTDGSFLPMWGETSVLTLFPVPWQRKRVGCFLAPSEVSWWAALSVHRLSRRSSPQGCGCVILVIPGPHSSSVHLPWYFHPKASLTQTRMDLTSHTFVLKTRLIFLEFL